jgi:hypothetical protein
MAQQTEAEDRFKLTESGKEPDSRRLWLRELYWSASSVGVAAIQGLCVFAVAAGPIRAALGIASAAASSGTSFIHSDPVRFTLRYVGAILALVTLFVTWVGWRVRKRPSARWRMRPLSVREKRTTWIGLVSSAISIGLILAEIWAHPIMHPR